MPNYRRSLAKLSPPRLINVVRRARLFERLDALVAHPIVWIAGEAGIGKTMLVASYLKERMREGIWYQVDRGDSDIATFFYYLGVAATYFRGASRRRMPLFSPEYRHDPAGFARRYFRMLFDRMPSPGTLVFDNLHEAFADPSVGFMLDAAFDEIPEATTVIIVSREAPPASLERHVAGGRIGMLNARELRLTFDEASEIVATDTRIDADEVEQLHRLSGGWAAGLILMMARASRYANGSSKDDPPERAAFNYLASEMFEKASTATQDLLLATAFLPRFTDAMARAISGNADAGEILEELHRRNFLVDRRGTVEPTYEFHALFRGFLCERVKARVAPARQLETGRLAAELLELSGDYGEAIRLYCGVGALEDAKRLIVGEAVALIAQGRHETLQEWIAAMPGDAVAADPVLLYWLAMARKAANPVEALPLFEQAFDRFDDRIGKLMAASGASECFVLEWGDVRGLERWIEAFETLGSPYPEFKSREEELRVLPGMLAAFVYRGVEHPLYMKLKARADALIAADPTLDHTLLLGAVSYYRSWIEEFSALESVGRHVNSLFAAQRLAPLTQVWWRCVNSYRASRRGDSRTAFSEVDKAEEAARRYALGYMLPTIYLRGAAAALGAGDTVRASSYVEQAAPLLRPGRHRELSLYECIRGWIQVLRGSPAAGLPNLRRACELAVASGMPHMIIHTLCVLGIALAETGDLTGAEQKLNEARAVPFSRISWHYRALCDFVEATLALRAGDDGRCREAIVRWLKTMRDYGSIGDPLVHHPELLAELYSKALEYGIEVETVRAFIEESGLPAPRTANETWPWPIKIRALGNFTLERDGIPVRSTGKSQRRLLELLMALIAYGGCEVNTVKLMQAVWPDNTAAQGTFDVAVHRLRKLLGNDRALLLHEGRLSLNPKICWVDVWAWEAVLRQSEIAEPARRRPTVGRILDLYRGRFLANEPENGWLVPTRVRLHSQFLRVVAALGGRLEQNRQWDDALALYQRGIEHDPLAEDIYRFQMRAYMRLGSPAEAINVYRRCSEVLSVVLGVKPSHETERLRASLLSG